MKPYIAFKKVFNAKSLFEIYFKYIQHKRNTGLDKLSCDTFEKHLDTNINNILKKINARRLKFVFYKARLISKGRSKFPRVISIPSIRDRLVIKAMHIMLSYVYGDEIKHELVHTIIDKVKIKSKKYHYFLKIDIENFYPSIDHDILKKTLNKKIRKQEILYLIDSIIRNKTLVSYKERVDDVKKGLPQGLSVANILSNIYMIEFDNLFLKKRVFTYFRYVDDILILHNDPNTSVIRELITRELKKINLVINTSKIEEGCISDEFTYLGYRNTSTGFSVRQSSVETLRNSIIKNFIVYKNSDDIPIEYLEWAINLRITGCKFQDKKYGWMFFYSQIDDLTLLYELDYFVEKIKSKYLGSKEKITTKKFVRTYHEITKNLSNTNYIPNFSRYNKNQKKEILNKVFRFKDPFWWDSEKTDRIFNNKIFQNIKELEKDIQRLS